MNTLAGVKIGKNNPIRLMGVINVSPESFFKGSVQTKSRELAKKARELAKEGADFIDVGAMSTAPYLKTQISELEEAKRLDKAIRVIRKNTKIPVSADTSRPLPALAALRAGAKILNDVHGLNKHPVMPAIAKKFKGVVLMANPAYAKTKLKNPINDTVGLLKKSLSLVHAYKIPLSQVAIDPGIGFFRQTKLPWWKWDLNIIQNLGKLKKLKCPVLVGVSRKSFIGHLMNGAPPKDRLPGSLAATWLAIQNGAYIIRTHDIKPTRDFLNMVGAGGLPSVTL